MEMIAFQDERFDELMMEEKIDEFDAQLDMVFGQEQVFCSL
jgi:hypothetical protein